MTEIPITKARAHFADIFDNVVHKHERVIIDRHGKDRVAVVSIEDLELLRQIEDRRDIADADVAMAEGGAGVSYDEIRKELGL